MFKHARDWSHQEFMNMLRGNMVAGLWPCERLLWLDWHGHGFGIDCCAGTGRCQGMIWNKDMIEWKLPMRRRHRGRERKLEGRRQRMRSVPIPHLNVNTSESCIYSKGNIWLFNCVFEFYILRFFLHNCWSLSNLCVLLSLLTWCFSANKS